MANLTVTTPYKRAGGRTLQRTSNEPATFDIPFTFVAPTSYTSGGEPIATADMPSGYTTLVTPWAVDGNGPYGIKLDVANKKLMFYGANGTATAAELGATNVQTVMGTGAITIYFRCC